MTVIKIVPMPGPQGQGGSGEGGDIADFVFNTVKQPDYESTMTVTNNDMVIKTVVNTEASGNIRIESAQNIVLNADGDTSIADFKFETVTDDGTQSTMTVANHDMYITTTRTDNQDADINIESADDLTIAAHGDDININANDQVRIRTDDFGNQWTFLPDGTIRFPDGTIQPTAYTPSGYLIPLPDFLTYSEGREALPTLNENFGWNSQGVWFGPTAIENEDPQVSYPVYTNFSLLETDKVFVTFDVNVTDFCSDIGLCVYLSEDTPSWNWGLHPSRIAAQFNCPSPELWGITESAQAQDDDIPNPGLYRVEFTYDPTAETDKVIFDYVNLDTGDRKQLKINEALPSGNYRIGFASDRDINDEGGPGGIGESPNPFLRTYISNLVIDVNDDTDFYSDSLRNGSSGEITSGTGDITFDGIQIIGGGTASSDGLENGTINLVPDAGLAANNQFLVIEPTSPILPGAPGHIHIRAGGTQDESNADLILGGERNSVTVSDTEKEIKVSTAFRSKRYYTNINSNSATEFLVSETADILIGDRVYFNESEFYVVDSISFGEGLAAVTASGVVFGATAEYLFTRDEPYNNQWSFRSDGVLSGPYMGGVVIPFLAGQQNSDLYIQSPSNDIVVDATNGAVTINSPEININSNAVPASLNINTYSGARINSARTSTYADEDKVVATLGDLGTLNNPTIIVQEGDSISNLTYTNHNALFGEFSAFGYFSDGTKSYFLYVNGNNGYGQNVDFTGISTGSILTFTHPTDPKNINGSYTVLDVVSLPDWVGANGKALVISNGPFELMGPEDDDYSWTIVPGEIEVSPEEISYLDGVTSNIQDQLNLKSEIHTETTFAVNGGTLGTQPTFSGPPMFSGSYVKTGPLVHFQIQVDMDNITSFGTGQYYVDLPFPAKYGYKFREGCLHDISAVRDYEIGGHVFAGQSQLLLTSTDAQGNSVYDIPFVFNNPVTLNAADNFHISGTYITAS